MGAARNAVTETAWAAAQRAQPVPDCSAHAANACRLVVTLDREAGAMDSRWRWR
jgi:hypothetical protein